MRNIKRRLFLCIVIACALIVVLGGCANSNSTSEVAIDETNSEEHSANSINERLVPLTLVAHNNILEEVNSADKNGPVLSEPPMSWIPIDGGNTAQSVVANSTFIGRGKVIDQNPVVRGGAIGDGGLVFTMTKINIDEIYAVDSNEKNFIEQNESNSKITIELLQTGGTYDGHTDLAPADAPLLVKNVNYILFLTRTDEGYYLPIGGHIGIAEIVNGKLVFLNDESADIFNNIDGEKLSKLISNIEVYAEDAPSSIDSEIVVNTSNDSISDFLHEIDEN